MITTAISKFICGIIPNRMPRAIASSRGRSNLLGGPTWKLYHPLKYAERAARRSRLNSSIRDWRMRMAGRSGAKRASALSPAITILEIAMQSARGCAHATPSMVRRSEPITSAGAKTTQSGALSTCASGMQKTLIAACGTHTVAPNGLLQAARSTLGLRGWPCASSTTIVVLRAGLLTRSWFPIMSFRLRKAGRMPSRTFNRSASGVTNRSGIRLRTTALPPEHYLAEGYRARGGIAA